MSGVGRREFLAGSAAVAIAGCGNDKKKTAAKRSAPARQAPGTVTIDFDDGDVAVVNFAFALEQLEAAYYARVVQESTGVLGDDALRTLKAIADHERIHAAFFKAVLGKAGLPALEPDFGKVDFKDRASILKTAMAFEDLGVSAYNGAGQFLTGKSKLGLAPLQAAGAIVSVEARHASAIRTLVHGDSSGAFAPAPFDEARLPGEVMEMAAPFLKTKVKLRNAPKAMRS